MTDISRGLRVEGPEPKAKKEDQGVCVEYLGVRVIIAPRMVTQRDKGIWVMVTHDHPDGIVEYELQEDQSHEPEEGE